MARTDEILAKYGVKRSTALTKTSRNTDDILAKYGVKRSTALTAPTTKSYLPTIGERENSVIGQMMTDSRMAYRQDSRNDNSLWQQTQKDRAAFNEHSDNRLTELREKLKTQTSLGDYDSAMATQSAINRINNSKYALPAYEQNAQNKLKAEERLKTSIGDYSGAIESSKKLAERQKASETHWTDRLANIVVGAGKQSLGATGSAFAVTTENVLDGDRKYVRGESMEQAASLFNVNKSLQNAQAFRAKTNALTQSGQAQVEKAKKGLGTLGRVGVDTAAGMTQLGADILIGNVTGLGVAVPLTTMGSLAVRAFGSAADQARAKGATTEQQIMYGLAVAAVEVFTERISSSNLVLSKAYGQNKKLTLDKVFTGIIAGLEDAASTQSGKLVMNRVGSMLTSGIGEGLEEGIAGVLEPLMARLTHDKDAQWDLEEIGYQVLVGALTGAVTGISGQNTSDYRAEMEKIEAPVPEIGQQKTDVPSHTAETAETQQLDTDSTTPGKIVDNKKPVSYDKSAQQAVEKAQKAVVKARETAVKVQESLTNAQTAEFGSPVVSDLATVLDTGTSAYVELGMKPKRAEAKAKVVQKLINGEQVSLDGMKSLNLTDPKYRAVFTQLTGVSFPEGMTNHDQLMNMAKTAVDVARNNMAPVSAVAEEANIPLEPAALMQAPATAAEISQPVITQDIPQPVAQVSGEAMPETDIMSRGISDRESFAEVYRAVRNAQAEDAEIDAEYGKYLENAELTKDAVAVNYRGQALTRKQFRDAFRAGNPDSTVTDAELNAVFARELERQVAQAHNDAGVGTTKTGGKGLFRDSDGAFRKIDIDTQKLLDKIGKKTGLTIVIHDKLYTPSGKKARGSYSHSAKELHLSLDAGDALMQVLRHELTHYLQDSKGKVYDDFVKFVRENVTDFDARFEAAAEKYEGVESDEQRIMDEVMSEYVEKLFTEEQFIDMIVKQDRTLAEKLFDAIKALAKKLQGVDDGLDSKITAGQKLWESALNETTKNTAHEDGIKRYSIEEDDQNDRKKEGPQTQNSRTGGTSEAERRFYEEAARRGQSCREINRVEQGSLGRASRVVRFSEVSTPAPIADQTKAELDALGVPAFIHGNDLEILSATGKILSAFEDAANVIYAEVAVADSIDLPPREVAGHEAFHYKYRRNLDTPYMGAVIRNLDVSSDAYLDLHDHIEENYFSGDYDSSDEKQKAYFAEELVAYVSGYVHDNSIPDGLLFDEAEVQEAWTKFIRDNSDKIHPEESGISYDEKTESVSPDIRYAVDSDDDFQAAVDRAFEAAYQESLKNPPAAPASQADGEMLGWVVYNRSAGAAALRFDPYTYLLNEYGQIEQTGKNYREFDIPKQTADDNYVTKSAATIAGAEATPDSRLGDIAQAVVDGKLSYETVHNKILENKVRNQLKNKGWDDTLADWTKAVHEGQNSAELIAMGATLLNNAGNSDMDGKAYIRLLADYAELTHRAGEELQAAKILKRLSPEGQLYLIQRQLDSLNTDELTQELTGQNEITIDEDLADRYRRAQTEEDRDAILEEIFQNIADQIPASWVDKFQAWRYTAMLGNLRTPIRSTLGNTVMGVTALGKRAFAGIVEAGMQKVGALDERTTSLLRDKETLAAAKDDFKTVKDLIAGGGKYQDGKDQMNLQAEIKKRQRVFKNAALEGWRTSTQWIMENEYFGDAAFSRATYSDALARYIAANGTTWSQASDELKDKARAVAIREAAEATFRDTNQFSQMVSSAGKVRHKGNKAEEAFHIVVEGVFPFKKTPANILVRATEYSPVGLLNALAQTGAKAVGKSDVSANEIIDNYCKGLTGSAILGLGMALANLGFLQGAAPDDEKEKELWEMQGHQQYAIEFTVGGKQYSYTIDWVSPVSIPLLVGAELYEAMQSKGLTKREMIDVGAAIFDPMLEMSMLQGLNDALSNAQTWGDEAALTKFVGNSIWGYMTQFIPTLLGQAERASVNTRMTTYADKNKDIPDGLQRLLGKASAKIPGVDYGQTVYMDAWGRTQANASSATLNAIEQFLSPGYANAIVESDMEKELLRLKEATGDSGVLIASAPKYFNVNNERKDLTAAEYLTYAKERGQTAYSLLTEVTESAAYKGMTDAQRVTTVVRAYDYANQIAKELVTNGEYAVDNWVAEAHTNATQLGLDVSTYLTAYGLTKDFVSLKDKNGETVDNSLALRKAVAVLSIPGLNNTQRVALADALGSNKTVLGWLKTNPSILKSKLAAMEKQYG